MSTHHSHPAKRDSKIQLVVFDLGRVLVRICDGWHDAFQRAQIELPAREIDPIVLHDIACRCDVGQLDENGFAIALSELTGLTLRQVMKVSTAFLHGPYPGSIDLVDDLIAQGYATACLSNTNVHHWRLMNDSTSTAYFPLHRLTHRFASFLIQARKPDPQIYAHVEQVTAVPPAEIVFFDDMPTNIAAARSRGWHAYHVDPRSSDPVAFMREKLVEHGLATSHA